MVCVSTTESRVWSCSTHNHMTSVRQVTVRLTRVKPAGDGGGYWYTCTMVAVSCGLP